MPSGPSLFYRESHNIYKSNPNDLDWLKEKLLMECLLNLNWKDQIHLSSVRSEKDFNVQYVHM